ncbi:alkaline phosphatase family protein, partial [Candidatus Zixiibacteriota bacterium]
MNQKVCIIGLDCADPGLVFERFADELPTLTALRQRGAWGPLRSCHPPITVPAWSVMLSGRDPGALGIYGFRNRKDRSYDRLSIATSLDVKVPRIWDHLTRPDDYSIVVGVPGTWPPPAIQGDLVSGFLAPMSGGSGSNTDIRWTYPPELAGEIQELFSTHGDIENHGDYQVDVREFRTEDKERLITEITEMTRKRFTLFRHLLKTRPWNFAVMVEIGLDRIHHGFWRHLDTGHRLHDPDSPYKEVIRDYYRLLDREIAETLEVIGFDAYTYHDPASDDPTSNAEPGTTTHSNHADTSVFIVSDHGARSLEGGFALNDWLIREGYLVLKREGLLNLKRENLTLKKDHAAGEPDRVPLTPDMIDWSRTRA